MSIVRPTPSRFRTWFWMILFLAAIAPGILSYAPFALHWDEAYYAHRVICMSREFQSMSLAGMAGCLAGSHKGPAIELVGLPWGRAGATESGIGLALVGLGFLNYLLALTTFGVAIRAGLTPWSLALAGFCIGLTPNVRVSAGALMTDILVAWCTALTLVLIALEARVPDQRPWPGFVRGGLWGLALMTGSLAKMTFMMFAAATIPILVWLRWRQCGRRALLFTLGGALLFSLPGLLVWALVGPGMVLFGLRFAFGEAAALWSVPGMTAGGYILQFFRDLHFALIPLGVLAVLFLRGILVEKVRLLPVAIVLVYLAVASLGQNRDPRYTLTLAIGLPMVLSWNGFREAPPMALEARHFLGGALIALLAAVPMVARPILGPVRHAKELLESLSRGKPAVIEIATDGPDHNIEIFQLARQIGGADLRPISLDTLVYDAVNKLTVADGYRRISAADYVLFLKPQYAAGPAWSRQWEPQYRAYISGHTTQMPQASAEFEVFKVEKP
jgi:hypothetical protein